MNEDLKRATLGALSEYSWRTTREVHDLRWSSPQDSGTGSTVAMLTRLLEDALIEMKRNDYGARTWRKKKA